MSTRMVRPVLVRKGSGAECGYIRVPRVSTKERRQRVGESAEVGEMERVPRMGMDGQIR